MKLSDFKGTDAFILMGDLVDIMAKFFKNEDVRAIYDEKKEGWVSNLLSTSLKKCPDAWLDLYCALNKDVDKESVNIGKVFTFATEVMNDEELMQLFFSQGKTTQVTSYGLATENTEV